MGDAEADFLVCGPSTALSALLITLANSRELRAWRLPFERIADGAQIDDSVGAGGVDIRWEVGGRDSRRVISPRSVRGVFCYGDTPRQFRKDVVPEDADYVQREFGAYFGFALSQFPNVINQPFCGSLTGYTETLPYQWNAVAHAEIGSVRAPDYGIATRLTPRDGIVYSSDFHSYTDWDSATLPRADSMPGQRIYLRYKRPDGDPCLIWFVDSAFIAIDPVTGDEASLSADERDRAKSLIDLFSGLFNVRLGQILVFLHGPPLHELTFGSVAPWLSFMQARPRLRHRFASALLDRLIDPCSAR
jgi:hypothetical protein